MLWNVPYVLTLGDRILFIAGNVVFFIFVLNKVETLLNQIRRCHLLYLRVCVSKSFTKANIQLPISRAENRNDFASFSADSRSGPGHQGRGRLRTVHGDVFC